MSTRTLDVRRAGGPGLWAAVAGALLLAALLAPAPALAAELPNLTVMGVAADGTTTPITAYRWLVEEDQTYHVQTLPGGVANPTAFDPNWLQGYDGNIGGETLAVAFHDSYTPVVAKGCVGFDDVGIAKPAASVWTW